MGLDVMGEMPRAGLLRGTVLGRPTVRCGATLSVIFLVFWASVGTARAQEAAAVAEPRAAGSAAPNEPPIPSPVPAVGPTPAAAFPPTPVPAEPLVVAVASSSTAVPREAFLEALQRTLQRPLVERGASGPGGEELSIRYDEQARELMVSCYRLGSGPVTRVIEAPSDPHAVPEAAALLAENLCARELVPPASVAMPEPAAPVLLPPPAPPIGTPDAAPVEFETAVVGAFYPFATNYQRPAVHTNFELNLIYGRVGALEGIGLGTVHYVEGDMSGLLVGGLVNAVGGRASGLLISGLATSVESLDAGVGLSLFFNHAAGAARGAQASMGLNLAGPVEGVQFAGLVNVAHGPLQGVQASFASNVAQSLEGAQIALVNVSGNVTGAQVGLVNVGQRVRGLQLGLVNVSDDIEGAPIGLFNVSRTGGVHVASWFSTTTYANLGVKLATRYTYSMLTLGYHREDGTDLLGGGLVIGGRIPALPQFWVALDVGGDYLLGTRICCYDTRTEERIAHTRDRNHFRLRVLPTWQADKHFSVFAGPAAALRVPFALYSNLPGYDQNVELLPEFAMGIEL